MDEKDLLIAQLRKENAALRQMIEDLQKQVKNLTEAVLLLRKNRFGSKSERTRNLLEEDGQLNLFNEIELEGDPKKKEKDPIQLSRNKVKVRQPKTQTGSGNSRVARRRGNTGYPRKRSQLCTVWHQAESHRKESGPGDVAIHSRQPEDNPLCAGQLRMSPLQTYGQSVHRSPESTGPGTEPFACFPLPPSLI